MGYFESYQSCSLFGALRYFANLKDSICLINGPAGCSFYARNAIINLNGYFESLERVSIPKIFTMGFSEEDVIFGIDEKLGFTLNTIIQDYHPQMVFVFNCCVSEIIGCDIDQITCDMQQKYPNTTIIAVHTAGFKGDQKEGMRLASELLSNKFFLRKNYNDTRRVNILGDFDYFTRSTTDLCKHLAAKGLIVNHIPGKSSRSELMDAPNACLNIITCQNASRYLAEIMEDRFGIPYIGKGFDLYGVKNTFNTYKQIYDFFGWDNTDIIAERDSCINQLSKYKELLRGKKAVIVAGTRRSLGYANMLNELDINIQLIFSESNPTYTKNSDFASLAKEILINAEIADLSTRIEDIKPDIILTTLPEMVAPNCYTPRLSEDFAGFDGLVRLAKYLVDATSKNSKNTFLID